MAKGRLEMLGVDCLGRVGGWAMLVNYFGYLNHTKIFNLLFISLHQELILETSIKACESTKLENWVIMFFVQFVAPIPCTETGKVIVNKF